MRIHPPATSPRRRVLFLNRSYWPDAEATGQLLTELCEDLGDDFDITVVAGQPNQNPDDAPVPTRERVRNVNVRRVWHTRFSKQTIVGRSVNFVTYVTMSFFAALFLRRQDIIVTETDPFLLPLIGDWLRKWHRAKHVVYLQDIYPDVAIALGKISESWFTCFLRRWLFATYRRADRVVALGDDMRRLLVLGGVPASRIVLIPNWADTTRVYPIKAANSFRAEIARPTDFVVMHSGNLGLSQNLDVVLDAAAILKEHGDIRFALVGDGASRQRLQARAESEHLRHVMFLPYQPKSRLSQSLSAADLHLVSLHPGVTQCLMPSKLYGILASGTPLLVVAPEDSEICRFVREEGLGVTAPPNDPAAIVKQIEWARSHPVTLRTMGKLGRQMAVDRFDRKHASGAFTRLFGILDQVPDDEHPDRSANSEILGENWTPVSSTCQLETVCMQTISSEKVGD